MSSFERGCDCGRPHWRLLRAMPAGLLLIICRGCSTRRLVELWRWNS